MKTTLVEVNAQELVNESRIENSRDVDSFQETHRFAVADVLLAEIRDLRRVEEGSEDGSTGPWYGFVDCVQEFLR